MWITGGCFTSREAESCVSLSPTLHIEVAAVGPVVAFGPFAVLTPSLPAC